MPRFDARIVRRNTAGEWTTEPMAIIDPVATRTRFGDDVGSIPFDIAAGTRGALAAIAYSAPFAPTLHPAPFSKLLPQSLRQTPVYMVDGQFVGSDKVPHTADDLGIAPADAAMFLGTPHFVLSMGGGPFTEVASPFQNPGPFRSVDIVADDAGFAVLAVPELIDVNGQQRAVDAMVRTSPDGITWSAHPDLPGINGARLGRVDGRLVASGHRGDGAPFFAELTDAGVWSFDVPDAPSEARGAMVTRTTFADSGIAAVYSEVPAGIAPTGGMPADSGNTDGYGNSDADWTGTPVAHAEYVLHAGMNKDVYQVRDHSNRAIGTVGGGGQHPTGRVAWTIDDSGFGIDVLNETGAVVDRFTEAEVAAANRAEIYELIASSDRGQTWSTASISELTAGGGGYPVAIEPFGDRFVVLVSPIDESSTGPTWVLVGHLGK